MLFFFDHFVIAVFRATCVHFRVRQSDFRVHTERRERVGNRRGGDVRRLGVGWFRGRRLGFGFTRGCWHRGATKTIRGEFSGWSAGYRARSAIPRWWESPILEWTRLWRQWKALGRWQAPRGHFWLPLRCVSPRRRQFGLRR